ncbi:rna-directed dna polymerase from mobile element jockey-like [Limosa lapponica baueri]|uniref:Rna-directed dna polymerase from mobile element jockey-like n=1 Tax=Limosa lapponica baueri TaxID=1758121 RepID=A0A2I0UU31_LIMLA|nr:rna-directed dna polymerase from mobile element jockey-like [Limosa lapponica baueri]
MPIIYAQNWRRVTDHQEDYLECSTKEFFPLQPGSVLGLVLFNIFVSDMNSGIQCTLSKPANNTKLLFGVDTLAGRNAIQGDLERLKRRACANFMKINQAESSQSEAETYWKEEKLILIDEYKCISRGIMLLIKLDNGFCMTLVRSLWWACKSGIKLQEGHQ